MSAELEPIAGAERVARAVVAVAGMADDLVLVECTVNGQPGLVVQHEGVTVTVLAFQVVADRITRLWAVRNPEKLRAWTTG